MIINEITKKTDDVTAENGYSLSNSNIDHTCDCGNCGGNHNVVSNEHKHADEQGYNYEQTDKTCHDSHEETELVVEKSCKVKLVHKEVEDVDVIYIDYEFKLVGLSCANCARKIENNLYKEEYVNHIKIDLINQILFISLVEGKITEQELIDLVTSIVKKLEPHVNVVLYKSNGVEITSRKNIRRLESQNDKRQLIKIAIGGIIFALATIIFYAFDLSPRFMLPLFILAYLILGLDVLIVALKSLFKGNAFNENLLMSISTVGAFIIGEYPEAAAVMLFYKIGVFFENYAIKKSYRSIEKLLELEEEYVTAFIENKWKRCKPNYLQTGTRILVKQGERVTIDGVVVEGNGNIDTKALTGESMLRAVKEKDKVLSGSIVSNGILTIETSCKYSESTAVKLKKIVAEAQNKKTKAESFIGIFSKYYTPIVVVLALVIVLVSPLLGLLDLTESLNRAFVFLVVSCPCALVISVPLSYFAGIGRASKEGILVKGGAYLEKASKINHIFFDKTGTLTKGNFKVHKVVSLCDYKEIEILKIAKCLEQYSEHPIAKSILEHSEMPSTENNFNLELEQYGKIAVSNVSENIGIGVRARIEDKVYCIGNKEILKSEEFKIYDIESLKEDSQKGSIVYLTENGTLIGYILIVDEIKSDSKSTLECLKKEFNIEVTMLTGDSNKIASKVANALNISKFYSELLPQDKLQKVEKYYNEHKNDIVACVGDGINDSPILARVDVGIAFGNVGSDIAIETSDVVIASDSISKVSMLIKIAKCTKAIVIQNIVLAIGIKVLFLLLGMFGFINLWLAVFGDVGVMILAVLNAIRINYKKIK